MTPFISENVRASFAGEPETTTQSLALAKPFISENVRASFAGEPEVEPVVSGKDVAQFAGSVAAHTGAALADTGKFIYKFGNPVGLAAQGLGIAQPGNAVTELYNAPTKAIDHASGVWSEIGTDAARDNPIADSVKDLAYQTVRGTIVKRNVPGYVQETDELTKNPTGFWDNVANEVGTQWGITGKVPFLGSALLDSAAAVASKRAAAAQAKGLAIDNEDQYILAAADRYQQVKQVANLPGKAAQVAAQMPTFVAEFAIAKRFGMLNAAHDADGVRKIGVMNSLGRTALDAGRMLPLYVPKSLAEAQRASTVQVTPQWQEKQVQWAVENPRAAFGTALSQALLTNAIEAWSEQMGPIGELGFNTVSKAVGKIVPGVINQYVSLLRQKVTGNLAGRIFAHGSAALAQGAGLNTMVGEVLEERFGDLAKYTLTQLSHALKAEGLNMGQENLLPSLEQLAVEVVGMTLGGGALKVGAGLTQLPRVLRHDTAAEQHAAASNDAYVGGLAAAAQGGETPATSAVQGQPTGQKVAQTPSAAVGGPEVKPVDQNVPAGQNMPPASVTPVVPQAVKKTRYMNHNLVVPVDGPQAGTPGQLTENIAPEARGATATPVMAAATPSGPVPVSGSVNGPHVIVDVPKPAKADPAVKARIFAQLDAIQGPVDKTAVKHVLAKEYAQGNYNSGAVWTQAENWLKAYQQHKTTAEKPVRFHPHQAYTVETLKSLALPQLQSLTTQAGLKISPKQVNNPMAHIIALQTRPTLDLGKVATAQGGWSGTKPVERLVGLWHEMGGAEKYQQLVDMLANESTGIREADLPNNYTPNEIRTLKSGGWISNDITDELDQGDRRVHVLNDADIRLILAMQSKASAGRAAVEWANDLPDEPQFDEAKFLAWYIGQMGGNNKVVTFKPVEVDGKLFMLHGMPAEVITDGSGSQLVVRDGEKLYTLPLRVGDYVPADRNSVGGIFVKAVQRPATKAADQFVDVNKMVGDNAREQVPPREVLDERPYSLENKDAGPTTRKPLEWMRRFATEAVRRLNIAYGGQVQTEIVDTVDQFPEPLRSDARQQQLRGVWVNAVYGENRTVYIVLARQEYPWKLMQAWYHEALGHHGVRMLLSKDDFKRVMLAMGGSLRAYANELGQTYYDLPWAELNEEQRIRVVEELFAHIAEGYSANGKWDNRLLQQRGLVERIWSGLRGGLLRLHLPIKWQERDLVELIHAASAKMRSGVVVAGGGDEDGQRYALKNITAQSTTTDMKREWPISPLPEMPAASLHEAVVFFDKYIKGVTFQTPIGKSFTANPGHFFTLVSGTPIDLNVKKGYVAGYPSGIAAYNDAIKGMVKENMIAGYQDKRAAIVPFIPDLLKNPDVVVLSNTMENTYEFYKRYDIHGGDHIVLGVYMDTTKNDIGPLSYHLKEIEPKLLANKKVVFINNDGNRADILGPAWPDAGQSPRTAPNTITSKDTTNRTNVKDNPNTSDSRFSVSREDAKPEGDGVPDSYEEAADGLPPRVGQVENLDAADEYGQQMQAYWAAQEPDDPKAYQKNTELAPAWIRDQIVHIALADAVDLKGAVNKLRGMYPELKPTDFDIAIPMARELLEAARARGSKSSLVALGMVAAETPAKYAQSVVNNLLNDIKQYHMFIKAGKRLALEDVQELHQSFRAAARQFGGKDYEKMAAIVLGLRNEKDLKGAMGRLEQMATDAAERKLRARALKLWGDFKPSKVAAALQKAAIALRGETPAHAAGKATKDKAEAITSLLETLKQADQQDIVLTTPQIDLLHRVAASANGQAISQMTGDQLQDFVSTMEMLNNASRSLLKAHHASYSGDIADLSEQIASEVYRTGIVKATTPNKDGAAGRDEALPWWQRLILDPFSTIPTKVLYLAGDGTMQKVFVTELQAAEGRTEYLLDHTAKQIELVLKAHKMTEEDLMQWKAKLRKVRGMELTGGEFMTLVLLSRNMGAFKKLFGDPTADPKSPEYQGNGFTVGRFKDSDHRTYHPELVDLIEMKKAMTPFEKDLADALMKTLNSGALYDALVQAAIDTMGTNPFTEANYWPLHVDPTQRSTTLTEIRNGANIQQMIRPPITIARVEHKAPLIIHDAVDVFRRHTSEAATMAGKMAAYKDALRILDTPIIKQAVNRAMGDRWRTKQLREAILHAYGQRLHNPSDLELTGRRLMGLKARGVLSWRPTTWAINWLGAVMDLSTKVPLLSRVAYAQEWMRMHTWSQQKNLTQWINEHIGQYAPGVVARYNDDPMRVLAFMPHDGLSTTARTKVEKFATLGMKPMQHMEAVAVAAWWAWKKKTVATAEQISEAAAEAKHGAAWGRELDGHVRSVMNATDSLDLSTLGRGAQTNFLGSMLFMFSSQAVAAWNSNVQDLIRWKRGKLDGKTLTANYLTRAITMVVLGFLIRELWKYFTRGLEGDQKTNLADRGLDAAVQGMGGVIMPYVGEKVVAEIQSWGRGSGGGGTLMEMPMVSDLRRLSLNSLKLWKMAKSDEPEKLMTEAGWKAQRQLLTTILSYGGVGLELPIGAVEAAVRSNDEDPAGPVLHELRQERASHGAQWRQTMPERARTKLGYLERLQARRRELSVKMKRFTMRNMPVPEALRQTDERLKAEMKRIAAINTRRATV